MRRSVSITLAVLLLLAGCGGMRPTVFLHKEFDFSYVERVAVIPFENLSSDQGAGARITRIFTTELLAAEVFDVVEPGEVSLALARRNITRTADLSKEQAKEIGADLRVQALVLGTVGESFTTRGSRGGSTAVTLTVRMVEVDQGQTVWSATHSEGGRGFWGSVFGSGEKSPTEVARNAVRRVIDTLID